MSCNYQLAFQKKLTLASSSQSSFSSSSCQVQSISTFFLWLVITSVWILLFLSFLSFSSRILRWFSIVSVWDLIFVMISDVSRWIYSRKPNDKKRTVKDQSKSWVWRWKPNLPLLSAIFMSPSGSTMTASLLCFLLIDILVWLFWNNY